MSDAADIAAFQRDGAVCLRGLLSPGEVARLRDGIDANLAHPSPRAKVASRPDDPGFFPGLADTVADGVLMHRPLFPLLWPPTP